MEGHRASEAMTSFAKSKTFFLFVCLFSALSMVCCVNLLADEELGLREPPSVTELAAVGCCSERSAL